MPIVTGHALYRAKTRAFCEDSSAIARRAESALLYGTRLEDTKPGSSFRKYLSKKYRDDRIAIAYAGMIYIFGKGDVLITVYDVPVKYKYY